jgi:hypothetical protein
MLRRGIAPCPGAGSSQKNRALGEIFTKDHYLVSYKRRGVSMSGFTPMCMAFPIMIEEKPAANPFKKMRYLCNFDVPTNWNYIG